MALNDDKKWKGAPYQMRPVTPYKMEAPAPVVQRVVPAVEKPAPVAAKPAPVAAKPAAPKPGAFARDVADTVAFADDAVMAPSKALADGVNRAAIGVLNVGRQGIGMAPVQPRQFNYTATQDKLAEVRAQNAAAQAPAAPAPAARPQIKFAGTDAMPDSMFKRPASAASRPGTQGGAGATSAAGAGSAPVTKSVGKFGETVYSNVGSQYGTAAVANPAGTIGSVQTQNFGNPVVPRVASTFGMSVNDPRINDQTPAIASPNAAARGFGLASADGTSRYYANKEDREAAKKLSDSMDTEAFRLSMVANNPGRRGRQAMETLAALRGQQAQLIGNQANNTTAQNNENTRGQFSLANTGMEQQGANYRSQLDANNRFQIAGMQDATAREGLRSRDRQIIQDRDGNYYQIGSDGPSPLTADGKPLRGAVSYQSQRNPEAEADDKLVTEFLKLQVDETGSPLPNALENAMLQLQAYRASQRQQGNVSGMEEAKKAGLTFVGYDPMTGRSVYQDKSGNKLAWE